jgi:hypothetical protein
VKSLPVDPEYWVFDPEYWVFDPEYWAFAALFMDLT